MGIELITSEGLKKLKKVLETMTGQRGVFLEEVKRTSESVGDDEIDHIKAKEDLEKLDKESFELANIIKDSRIQEMPLVDPKKVIFGSLVDLRITGVKGTSRYRIVGNTEIRYWDKGATSVASPLSEAIMGLEVGEEAEIDVRNKTIGYEILEIINI